MPSSALRGFYTFLTALFGISAFVLNGILIISVGKALIITYKKELKESNKRKSTFGHWLLMIYSCSINSIGGILWLIMTSSAAADWSWKLGSGYCNFETFLSGFVLTSSCHIYLCLALERLVKLSWPSRHADIFSAKVICVLLSGLLIFDIVVAMMSVVFWTGSHFVGDNIQCLPNWNEGRSHLIFFFVVAFAAPFVATSIIYIWIGVKLIKIKKSANKVVEEDKNAPVETYADKIKSRRQLTNNKRKNLFRDESTSEDENTPLTDYKQHKGRNKKRRIFPLKIEDAKLAASHAVATYSHHILWLIFFVYSYIWYYNTFNRPDEVPYTVFTILTFFTPSLNPIVMWTTSFKYRRVLIDLFTRRKPNAGQ